MGSDVISEDDSRLVLRLKANENGAFEELVRHHGGRMLAVARRLLRNEEHARDAVQEAMLQAFRGMSAFQGGARLGSWLHRIVVNAALMRGRALSRRPEESIDELLPEFDATGHQKRPMRWDRDAIGMDLERRELQDLVRSKIDQLPESWRTVLILREIEGLDCEETGKLLGVTPNAVKVRLHRARQALKTLLDGEFGDELT